MGDYNTVFSTKHRINGNVVRNSEVRDGCHFMEARNLTFLKSVGYFLS